MTPKQTILAAADLVRKGWCQGSFCEVDTNGNVCSRCLLSAVTDALDVSDEDMFDEVANLIYDRLDRPSMVIFNDEPGRTQAEVVAILESAAASLDDGKEEHNDQT